MCFLCSFMPATMFVVLGYFVLFSATKAEGGIHRFGQVLAIWIFVIAAFFPIMGAVVTVTGNCPMDKMFEQMMEQQQEISTETN